jgi:hypothetical protein
MADHQFEKKISQQMADFKLKPSADVWQRVESQIQEDRRRRRWFFILPIAALLLGFLLYAVWPLHTNTKTQAVATLNNTAVEKNKPYQTDSSLTITPSSTQTTAQKTEQATTIKKQAVQQSTEDRSEIVTTKEAEALPLEKNPVQQQQPSKSTATKQSVAVTKSEKEKTKPASTTTKVTDPVVEETKPVVLSVNPTKEIATVTTRQSADSVVAVTTTEIAVTSNNTAVVTEKDSTAGAVDVAVADTAAATHPVPQISIPRPKLQWGFQVNAGFSEIKESLFPGGMMKAETVSYFGGGLNNQPATNISRITRYEYAVKPSLQFGAGIVLRKPFQKKHAFVTGLQYQYSSYTVMQLQKIDTFLTANNFFSNLSTDERRSGFQLHAISIPLEMEWKLASFKKGTLLFQTGIQQNFTIASVQTDALYSFRYTATADRSSVGPGSGLGSGGTTGITKATVWQPMLHLSPAYEWMSKKFSSQVGLYFNYGLRPAYKTSETDYWLQAGVRYRVYFKR